MRRLTVALVSKLRPYHAVLAEAEYSKSTTFDGVIEKRSRVGYELAHFVEFYSAKNSDMIEGTKRAVRYDEIRFLEF